MAIIPTGFAQINWQFTGDSCPTGAETTLGVDLGSFTDPPDDLAVVAGNLWETHINPQIVTTCTLSGVLVKYGPNATGPSAQITTAHVGNLAAAGAAPNTTYLVRKVTALGGRAGSGRMYVPGVTEDDVDPDGTVTPAMVTLLQSNFDDLWDALDVGGFTPVLLHSAGSPLSTPTPITSLRVDARVATQRRRLRR